MEKSYNMFIFERVRIIASIFMLLAAFLNVQPLIGSKPMTAAMKCCSKKMKCAQKEKAPRNQCANNSCNPFMACAYGNFFLLAKNAIEFNSMPAKGNRLAALDDKRLSDRVSDCWHPPKTMPRPS
jgi:hypothetical protein